MHNMVFSRKQGEIQIPTPPVSPDPHAVGTSLHHRRGDIVEERVPPKYTRCAPPDPQSRRPLSVKGWGAVDHPWIHGTRTSSVSLQNAQSGRLTMRWSRCAELCEVTPNTVMRESNSFSLNRLRAYLHLILHDFRQTPAHSFGGFHVMVRIGVDRLAGPRGTNSLRDGDSGELAATAWCIQDKSS